MKVKNLKPNFLDDRGHMTLMVNQERYPIKSVLRIYSKEGTIRGNHYHKKGIHYYFVESGECKYYEKPANKPRAKVRFKTLKPGDLILVKPYVVNATKFLKDSVIYHFDTQKRDRKHYEENTVRMKII